MPAPDRVLSLLDRAAMLCRATPGRAGRVLRLTHAHDVLVVGDLHGNVENFRAVLTHADLARHPRRHLVLQELVHGPFRYAGGGDKSHQLVDLLAALKCQYPERVHYLLGNHEMAQWRGQLIAKGESDYNQLFLAGVHEAYGDGAERILSAYYRLFEVVPLAIHAPNRVLLTHSLPANKHLLTFNSALLERDDVPDAAWKLGGTFHALVWGRDTRANTVASFLAKMEADWLITGHIPCEEGYAIPNERQVILDALGTPACACLFPCEQPITLEDLKQGIVVL